MKSILKIAGISFGLWAGAILSAVLYAAQFGGDVSRTVKSDGNGTILIGDANVTGVFGATTGYAGERPGAHILVASENYDTTTSLRNILSNETGMTFSTSIASSDDPVTFLLPDAAKGLLFRFVDGNLTAAADLRIQAQASNTINGGTAGKIYECTGDAAKQSCTIQALDSTRWEVISEVGTWANNNN